MNIRRIATMSLALTMLAGTTALAQPTDMINNQRSFQLRDMQGMTGNPAMGAPMNNVTYADSASAIVTSNSDNTAAALKADLENAATITVTDEDSQVNITESGTYIITGAASSSNITVKKGVTGVVLILRDLDMTSTTGATLSVNKEAEVKVVVSGSVTLTDAENPEDENSEDEAVAGAYDGAVIKVKASSSVCVTGDGTLTLNGVAKNGIKTGDDASLVIDGADVSITAANDGINASYDVTILNGSVTIDAVDDAIHADHILTVGGEETSPTVNVVSSTEGLEGTVVNIFSGEVTVKSTDDAINAANKNGTYAEELAYAINITGGTVNIDSTGDGLDSNGDINITGGTMNIRSASDSGEAGIDYDGQFYVSENSTINNLSGISGPDGMPGMDGMNGPFGMGEMPADGQQSGERPEMPTDGQQSGERPEMPTDGQQSGERPEMPTDGQQSGERSEMPTDSQQSGERPEMPTDGQQSGERPEMPTDDRQSGERPEMPADGQQSGERPEMPTDSQQSGERPEMTSKGQSYAPVPEGEQPTDIEDDSRVKAFDDLSATGALSRKEDRAIRSYLDANKPVEGGPDAPERPANEMRAPEQGNDGMNPERRFRPSDSGMSALEKPEA